MIIPGHAVLSLSSPTPEPQATREEESGFGQLLTEIELQTKPLPDQEDGERRALESVLQVLMSMFQSFTPISPALAVATPRAAEAGVMSVGRVGGPALGWPPDLVPAAGLGETGNANLPPGLTQDASHDIRPSTFPATAVLQESVQALRECVMTPPTTALSLEACGPVAGNALISSPGPPTTALSLEARGSSTTGALSDLPMASTPTPQLGTPSGATSLDTTASFPGDSVLATAERRTPLLASIQRSQQPEGLLSAPLSARTGFLASILRPQQPEGPSTPDLELRSLVGPTQPAGVPASLLALPQSDTAARLAADSYGLQTMSGIKEEGALAERAHSPSPRRATESTERASEAMPSVPYLAADGAFPSPVTRATSHTSADGSDTSVPPPSRSLEDVTASRQWPRPGPANTMLLHLDPPELGALLVQVRVSEKRLIASFRAQSPEAEALLRIHLPALHESLSQQGFEVRPMVITQASEGFSSHLGAGTGAFTQQHSASQGFTQDRHAAGAEGAQHDMDLHRTIHWPAEQRPRLLDVMI